MKAFLLITVLSLSPALAQFGWDDEPASDSVLDQFNTALRTPAIEPIRPIEPVIEPIVPVFQPFVAPVVSVDPLVEQCDLEPQVAQVYRAAEIAEDDGDCPEFLRRLSANPYATDAPKIVAQDGTYLGELSDNPYDPDSVANPYGRYGSPYSPTSIKKPYSTYGSPYSSQSPNNPYATQAPLLFGD